MAWGICKLAVCSLGFGLLYLSCCFGMPYAEAPSLKLLQSVAASGSLAESYSSKLCFCYFVLEALASQRCSQACQAGSSLCATLLLAAYCFVVAYCKLSWFSSELTFFFGSKLGSQAVPICIPSWPSWFCGIKLPKLIPIVIVFCWPLVFKLGFASCWS